MVSARSLVGLPVRTRGGARHIGVVRDVCLDPSQGRLCGLLISTPGLIRSHYLLYWQDIDTVDQDAIWIGTRDVLREVTEASNTWWFTDRTPGIWGRDVRDSSGQTIGLVGDILIDATGQIVGCKVSDGVVKDFLDGQQTFLSTVHVSEDGSALTLTPSGNGSELA